MVITKTAGIIIIGNEILSGKVQDVNSHYLATELRASGVDVRRISIIPDDVDVIAKEAVSFSAGYDHVFTTGGIGPTHDDVTMEGIAKGFGVNLVRNGKIKEVLAASYRPLNDAVLKMADIPEGADVIFNNGIRFPLVYFRNIFIFPGIPGHLRARFPLIREIFRSSSFYLKRIYLKAREADIADILSRVEEEHDGLCIGSYPVVDDPVFNLIITVESRDEDVLKNAFVSLLKDIPEEFIVRTE
jgi:molybdenum cofactor synthesis domain-containing protein